MNKLSSPDAPFLERWAGREVILLKIKGNSTKCFIKTNNILIDLNFIFYKYDTANYQ